MRTTLSIDDDVLLAARQLAHANGESIGTTISRLARGSLTASKPAKTRNGITLLPLQAGARASTLDDVNRLRDELP